MAVESTARKKPAEATPLFRSAPHNIEVEQALLGAILVNNEAFYRVSDFLEPEHFFEPLHQKIYKDIGSLVRAGKAATPQEVQELMRLIGYLATDEAQLPRQIHRTLGIWRIDAEDIDF